MIYAIQAASGPIKIGISHEPTARLYALQVSNHEQLTLLGASQTTWDEEVEKFLHDWCAPHHIRGEWFKPKGSVVAAAKAIIEGKAESFATRRRAATLIERNPKYQHATLFIRLADEEMTL